MRKLIFMLVILISSSVFGVSSDHLSDLNFKFPYGLLGDDYGILTIEDLALNACRIKPEPFAAGSFTPYEYWQCFESRTISVECGNIGRTEGEGVQGRVAVMANSDHKKYKYIESRPWPVHDCRNFAKDLKRIIKGTSHTCISASYIENNFGIFHRLKTSKGYEGESAELTDKVRRDFCPDLRL